MNKKARITKEEVKKAADLARLQLSDVELAAAARDLQNILSHFSAIQAINTAGVPMADDSSGLTSVVREDAAKPQDLAAHQQLLDSAPETQENQIKVGAVFKEK